MAIGDRILERMAALNVNQSELARRVGVSQPTIHNLIHRSKRGSTQLHKVARELRTTAAYLAGETNDPTGEPNDDRLSSEEQRLLEIYRDLPKKDRAALKLLVERMAKDESAGD